MLIQEMMIPFQGLWPGGKWRSQLDLRYIMLVEATELVVESNIACEGEKKAIIKNQ